MQVSQRGVVYRKSVKNPGVLKQAIVETTNEVDDNCLLPSLLPSLSSAWRVFFVAELTPTVFFYQSLRRKCSK